MRRGRLLAVWISVAGLVARAALGAGLHAPTVWERAVDPLAASHEKAHHAVESLLAEADRLHMQTPMAKEKLLLALHILEAANAAAAADPRLRLDLGRVLYLVGDYEKAASALEGALREMPDAPASIDAYFQMAICYARLGRPKEEMTMYDEYLRRETEPSQRANALSNRGESGMRMPQGDFAGAIKDYRASLELVPDSPLAHWGLAVALDRTGDPAGGLNEAKMAINYDPLDQKLHNREEVFFVPAYDIIWYDALGAIARASQIDDPATSLLWWETAVAKWGEYVAVAAADDRWIPLAKAHEAASERELRAARRRAQRSTKPRR